MTILIFNICHAATKVTGSDYDVDYVTGENLPTSSNSIPTVFVGYWIGSFSTVSLSAYISDNGGFGDYNKSCTSSMSVQYFNDANGQQWQTVSVTKNSFGNCAATWDSKTWYALMTFASNPPPLQDSDSDGRPDKYDLYPNSIDDYTAGISAILYDSSTGELVAGVITTDNGDKFSFGTIPSDLSGYTSESIEGDITMDSSSHLQANLENINGDLNLTNLSSSLDVAADGTFDFNAFVSSTSHLPSLIIDNITADNPSVGTATDMQTGQASTGSETDNEALIKIVDNTKASNDNQKRIADYLKSNNDLLAQVSKKIGQSSSSVSISGDSGPTANEIGQAVNDNLIDTGQTHDDSQTTGLSTYDFGTKFDDEKTKYVTRFTTFTNTFKNSTLFTLPGSLIGSIPSGGVSTYDVNIGKWGSATDSNISFDFSDYNAAWDMLKYVLPILTAFSVLKILILKQQ